MIVQLSDRFFAVSEEGERRDRALEVCQLLEYGHYLSFQPRYLEILDAMVQSLSIPKYQSLYRESNARLNPRNRICECLTTVSYEDLDSRQRKALLQRPSEVLLENVSNEWPLYERFVNVYLKDQTYQVVMNYLNQAIQENRLVGAHLGGLGEVPKMLAFKNDGKRAEYRGVYRYKVCVIVDRDTSDNHSFNESHNAVYRVLANGKDAHTLTEADIYKLDFGEGYVWHQWYKRSIENYFPKAQYEEQGMDISLLPENPLQYDYYHFEEGKGGYEKSMVQQLGKGLNKEYYEQCTRAFAIGDGSYSEILLVLLKIAKIV